MWPKALTQLIELAPHVTRLLPLADRYFKDKTTGDEAVRQTLDAHRQDLDAHQAAHQAALQASLDAQSATLAGLGDRLHADLDALTLAQTTQTAHLQREVADFEKHLASTRADALAAKQATESVEGRLARIEATQHRAQTLAVVALAFLLAILILIATLFLRAR